MATSLGGIYVDLGLNQARFQDGLRGAQTSLKKFGGQAEGIFAGAAKNFAKGLLAGVAAGGIAGVLGQFRDVARSVATIGDEAKRAGLSFRAFQEWSYIAQQSRVSVDAVIDGFKELSLRGDEFVKTGAGPAAEAFGRLGYSAEQLTKKLADPSELLLEIFGRIQNLDKAAQIRIFDELLGGTGGERFVELISKGEAGLRQTIAEAHNLGAVMDDEVIERAAELDRKFNAITTAVGTGLKTAIVEAAGALQSFIDRFRGFAERYALQKQAMELGDLAGSLAGTKGPAGPRTTETTDRLPLALPDQPDLAADYVRRYREELALANRERAIAAEAERILAETASKGISITKAQAEALAAEKIARDESLAASEKAATATEAERQKVLDLIEALEFEVGLIGMSDEAKRAANITRQAGAAATEKEISKLVALNETLFQEAEARKRLKELEEQAAKAGDHAFGLVADGIASVIDKSATAEEALKRLLIQLALIAAQSWLFGTGPLGGLLGGGVFAADGGVVRAAGGGRVVGPGTGRSDSIPARLSDGEFVVNARDTAKNLDVLQAINSGHAMRRLSDGGLVRAGALQMPSLRAVGATAAYSPTVNFSPVIDARGASPGVGDEIKAALKSFEKEFTPRTLAALRDIKRRGLG